MADENGIPLHMLSSEGRIVYKSNGNTWFTETQVKDHASTSLSTGFSSVRAVCSRNSTNGSRITRQVDSYYPFGMNIKELSQTSDAFSANEYMYNGKMYQDEMGLGLLDYGARMYDAVLGRWHVVDPILKPQESPYAAFSCNPIRLIDLMGTDTSFANDADRKYVLSLLNKDSDNYSEEFANKFNDLATSKTMYFFESHSYGEIKDSEGNIATGVVKKDEGKENTVSIQFGKGDDPITKDENSGRSEFGVLFEETYHAWDYNNGSLDLNNLTATSEAEAWKFASNAPGTICTNYGVDKNGSYVDQTVMGRINAASVEQVATWFKTGMPTIYNTSTNSGSYGINDKKSDPLTRQKLGLYYDLPLK